MTKNKIYKILVAVVLVLGGTAISSCSGFLDEEPRGVVTVTNFYRNAAEARQGVNGIYRNLSSTAVTGSEIKQIPNDLIKRATWDEGGGLNNFTYGAENSSIATMWRGHYSVIKDCNSLIDNVTANSGNIDDWELYVAQARGVRGFLYFDLVRWFGDVPLVITETKTLADLQQPRAPRAEVFGQIIADLEYCVAHSMEKGDTRRGYQYGRFTCDAARGMLAKVYLWLGSVADRDGKELLGSADTNYRKALEMATAVIAGHRYSLVPYYPDVFNAKTRADAQMEVLFCTQGLTGDNTGTWTGMTFGIRGAVEYGGAWDGVSSSDYHRMVYEPSDSVRRLWNCPRVQILEDGKLWGWDYPCYWDTRADQKLSAASENTSWIQWSVGKFRRYPLADPGSYNYTNFGMDEPLLRYADILLIYAESYNEVHKGGGPYTRAQGIDLSGAGIASGWDAVNLVRRRARTANVGVIHEDPLPRRLKGELANMTETCVPDWRPGFFGYIYDGVREVKQYRGYASDYEAFREEILTERARELVAEGTDRWCDLVRRGRLERAMQNWREHNPYISGTERSILIPGAPENVSKKHYLLPIPLGEMDVNKKLTQNPGY